MSVLSEKLKLLHSLNIAHCDIKPENIMYSREFGEPVFIDFGLTKSLKESVGEKTLTEFVGTFNYASPDMKQLISSGKGYVDMYANDYRSLGLSKTKNF